MAKNGTNADEPLFNIFRCRIPIPTSSNGHRLFTCVFFLNFSSLHNNSWNMSDSQSQGGSINPGLSPFMLTPLQCNHRWTDFTRLRNLCRSWKRLFGSSCGKSNGSKCHRWYSRQFSCRHLPITQVSPGMDPRCQISAYSKRMEGIMARIRKSTIPNGRGEYCEFNPSKILATIPWTLKHYDSWVVGQDTLSCRLP